MKILSQYPSEGARAWSLRWARARERDRLYKVTPVILHGVVSVILHGVASLESARARERARESESARARESKRERIQTRQTPVRHGASTQRARARKREMPPSAFSTRSFALPGSRPPCAEPSVSLAASSLFLSRNKLHRVVSPALESSCIVESVTGVPRS